MAGIYGRTVTNHWRVVWLDRRAQVDWRFTQTWPEAIAYAFEAVRKGASTKPRVVSMWTLR